MSVHLLPNNALGFNRPFTQLVKTTAPKLYCVRPNSGRIEPGESIDVSVMLQPMKEEPPLSTKCKDKFLIQSTIITPEKETKDLQDIWSATNVTGEEWKVHQQKLRVVYLPREGQTVDEEPEDQDHPQDGPSAIAQADSGNKHYGTTKDIDPHAGPAIPTWSIQAEGPSSASPPAPIRPMTPPTHEDVTFFHAEAGEHLNRSGSNGLGVVNVNVHQISPPSSPPIVPAPAAVQVNRELETKLQEAQAEILRLRALLAAVPDPSSTAPESAMPESVAPSEFRSKYASSDDGTSTYYAPTEMGTMVDRETVIHQDGVPLQASTQTPRTRFVPFLSRPVQTRKFSLRSK
ncbi:PapD-like protein [Scleroderma yunnanense]